MNAFADTKQYKKILLLFLLTLCLSSFIAPIIKVFLDTFISSSPFIKDLLKYRQDSYEFGKAVRRIMMAAAILLIFLLRRPLKIGSFVALGMKPIHGWWRQLRMGFILSTGMFLVYIIFSCFSGVQVFQPDVQSFGGLMSQFLKILVIAGVVGCIEEIFFRGFILQSLLVDMQAVSAVCFSSLFFSLLHFFKAKIPVSPGFQPFIGFVVIYQSFKEMTINFTAILPSVIGLFLVGVVLSYACIRTKSLYLPIGLHAGWIFLIQVNKIFFDHVRSQWEWLFGDSKIITGVMGWSLLIFTLILIRFVTKVSYHGKDTARAL